MADDKDRSVEEITKEMSQMSLLCFRKIDDVKRLALHFRRIIDHPLTQQNAVIQNYLKRLDESHRRTFTQKREGVQVEYIFTPETKNNLQRQRFNSLPVSEVPELLKMEFPSTENAEQVHICTDCDVEIEMNDEEPLMESLQKHFNLSVHLPKMKRESIDVAEPILLPNMSRRKSALERGEIPADSFLAPLIQRPNDKLDRLFSVKLEASLIQHLPDKSESSIDAAIKFYQSIFDKLCSEISGIDFSTLTSTVAPIIMSIKDNVNQNFAVDPNKIEIDEEQSPEKPAKNQMKKYRYYGPIENIILKLLSSHKLLTLIDDRTGKPAFFCIACEYYTLRFRYDSVLSHVFSDAHVANLVSILENDELIPFSKERTFENVKELNQKFLQSHSIIEETGLQCNLCKTRIDVESCVTHVLDENHLGKLSDKLYRKAKAADAVPEEWGPKSLDWAKFISSSGKPLSNKDHVVIENFIKPSGKVSNYCSCCDMNLKGPRQVLFNHIRQKKHLRNAAPLKLGLLYKNQCRPVEYYASFGNYYLCSICPVYVSMPSFAAAVEHFDSDVHIESIAKLITILYTERDMELFAKNHIVRKETGFECEYCDLNLENVNDTVSHILSSIQHQNCIIEAIHESNKGDIISCYMKGNYVLYSEGTDFNCVVCKGTFGSIRSLLNHLVFAEHFKDRPSSENIFRFYLELKHNVNLLQRNKYIYFDFGRLRCGVCETDIAGGENAKKHVVSQQHRESMGASYVNVNLEAVIAE